MKIVLWLDGSDGATMGIYLVPLNSKLKKS